MAIRETLQSELTAAMKRRDIAVIRALRTVLGALSNAEAVPAQEPLGMAGGTAHVAGGAIGVGATETPRQLLTEDHQRAIVAAEADELTAHAERLTRLCRRDEADAARRAAGTLSRALDGAIASPGA